MNHRQYTKVFNHFWFSQQSKAIAKCGRSIQVLAFYLMTSPHSNMTGIFHQPIAYMAHDIQMPIDELQIALNQLCDLHFCFYDEKYEYIWVCEVGHSQLGKTLNPRDKRIKAIHQYIVDLPELNFMSQFNEKYQQTFHLHQLNTQVTQINELPIVETGSISTKKTVAEPDVDIVSEQTEEAITESAAEVNLDAFVKNNTSLNIKSNSSMPVKVSQDEPIIDPVLTKADPILAVFSYWKARMEHDCAQLDNKRRKVIKSALDNGYKVDQLCNAINGCYNTPYNMGKNDNGERYDSLQVILRDSDQIDRFIHNSQHPPQVQSKSSYCATQNEISVSQWLNNTGTGAYYDAAG